jgi:hypothetical protein
MNKDATGKGMFKFSRGNNYCKFIILERIFIIILSIDCNLWVCNNINGDMSSEYQIFIKLKECKKMKNRNKVLIE